MNAITNFRKCTLTNEELMQMVDQQTDAIFTLGKIPTRHIPARPNKDYDLLVGELILRFKELTEQSQLHAIMQAEGSDVSEGASVASEGQEEADMSGVELQPGEVCGCDWDIPTYPGSKQCTSCNLNRL